MTKDAHVEHPHRDTVHAAILALGRGDIEGAVAYCSEDVSFELPYAPPGMPAHQRGKRDVYERFLGALGPEGRFASFEFIDVSVSELRDQDRVLAEYASRAVTKTGERYANQYVGIFDLVDGKISRWREFFDPLRVSFQPPAATDA